MVELTSEEQSYLRRLQVVSERGESVDGFIWGRLNDELSTLQSVNSYGEEIRTYTREYDIERRVYETLAKKGLLDGRSGGEQNPKYFGELTSEGRCWFLDRDEAARIERENVRGGRRHDYLVALFSVVSGAIAGFIGGAAAPTLIALIRTALRM